MNKPQAFPNSASVVVIGGGVMGCSVLYHLAKMGVKDVVLLERKQLTCGTTWHSAAQVRQLRSSNNMTEMIKYSTQLYAGLEAETGQSTGWTETGSLMLATSEDRFTFTINLRLFLCPIASLQKWQPFGHWRRVLHCGCSRQKPRQMIRWSFWDRVW